MKLGWAGVVSLAILGTGCQKETPPTSTTGAESTSASTGTTATSSETPKPVQPTDGLKELVIEDVKKGSGPAAEEGDILIVQYTGSLKDGTVFDSNDKREAAPFPIVLGQGSVIKGWEKGLIGVRKGGERKLSIPSEMGYGEKPVAGQGGGIPPYSDLYFTVKVLDMVKKAEEGVYDKTDVKIGTGPAAKTGDRLQVHYSGTFVNGKPFDSSRERNAPFEFVLGTGGVIAGWDAGIVGMKPGGVRKLRIPPAIAYGANGSPPTIAPNQVLLFEIELLKILK